MNQLDNLVRLANVKIFLKWLMIASLFCIVFYYYEDTKTMKDIESHIDGDSICFDKDSGIYDREISVRLNKSLEFPFLARIYYTTNGDDPRVNGVLYSHRIKLELLESVAVYPIKAVVYYNGEYSDVYEHTYILDAESCDEFKLSIASITCDHADLYDYYRGIMVPGVTQDIYIQEHPGEEHIKQGNYSNRTEEWIRDAYVTMFDEDGNKVIDQKIGIGISGDTSAENDVKSLKLYAGSEYDANADSFSLLMDNQDIFASEYSFVSKYNSIRLRSGAQDLLYGNVRSAIFSRLANESGFNGCSGTRRCIVYLNGQFYGIFDIQQNYSDSFLANRFGLADSDAIEKYKGGETIIYNSTNLSYYFEKDLNIEENRHMLEEVVDMDNYLLYYAINILCNNTDWPQKNYEIWRYIGEEDESNPYSDGRYRFLMYDPDLIFYSENNLEFFPGSLADNFQSIMEGTTYRGPSIFPHVMESQYYRDKFVTIICDLMNTSFSDESIQNIITEENEKIAYAREYFYGEEFVGTSQYYVGLLLETALRRSDQMEENFNTYFGLKERYVINLEVSDGVTVSWDNMRFYANETYENQYFKGVNMTMTAEAYPGYQFSGWLVNGRKVSGKELIITKEMLGSDNAIEIKTVAEKDSREGLIISAVNSKGDSDYYRITNCGSGKVNLQKYYATDEANNLYRYQLPDVELDEKESVIIYCKNSYQSIGDYICNFNLSEGEHLIISDGQEWMDDLVIPDLDKIEVFERYDNSSHWVHRIATENPLSTRKSY